MTDVLRGMLQELLAGRLEVCKVRSRFGGYVRCTLSCNAEWYQRFCAAHVGERGTRGGRFRRPRTIIRRRQTVAALERMLRGDLKGEYAARLKAVAEQLEGGS